MRALVPLILAACTPRPEEPPPAGDTTPQETAQAPEGGADVEAVSASGEDGAWTFSVTLRSPDTGCERYADWWELVSPEGTLVHRRVLNHSHPEEQPFTRSGDPVDVTDTEELVVRGHMSDSGYGGVAYRGTVDGGFSADASVGVDWAAELAEQAPLPEDCWW
jgi:hypothetical protein